MSSPAEKILRFSSRADKSAKDAVLENAANELVFAVVGHVGSGTTEIAQKLISLLKDAGAIGDVYDVAYIKATDLIGDWARKSGRLIACVGQDRRNLYCR